LKITIVKGVVKDLREIIVYPIPFRSAKHTEIYFKGIGKQAEIRIFNIFGELVRRIDNVDQETTWDIRNDFGRKVSSGIYIYIITNKEGKRTGKLAIIK